MNIKLLQGDAVQLCAQIESNSIDCLYTDPPYEMNYKTNIPGSSNWNKSGYTESKFDVLPGDDGGIAWDKLWCELYRVAKKDSFFFIHCNIDFLSQYKTQIEKHFTYRGTVAWSKNFAIGGNLKSAMKRDWEPIMYFTKGNPQFNPIQVTRKGEVVERKRISEINDWAFTLGSKEKCGHPTQKPQALVEQILRLCTKENDIVLDPFAGSGTTGLAAKNLNRFAILIELSKDFEEIIRKRISF